MSKDETLRAAEGHLPASRGVDRGRVSASNEHKQLTNKFAWRYIPDRYQATVAVIVSGFLYYGVFEILFNPFDSGGDACGTLLRPVLREPNELGWIWDAGISLWSLNESLACPRHFQGLGWEFFAVQSNGNKQYREVSLVKALTTGRWFNS